MANTWSSKPFISYDGPDKDGVRAEVKVITGFGKVTKITPSKKGNSQQVEFSVENTEYMPTGWVPVSTPISNMVEDAHNSGEAIHFRIEVRRKDGVERTLPINEISATATLAKDNIYRSLAAVKLADDDNWTISNFAKTRLDEDPNTAIGGSAYDYSPEELAKYHPMKSQAQTSGVPSGPQGFTGIESPESVVYNPDGSLNPGSLAVAQPLAVYEWVANYFKDSGVDDLVDEKIKISSTKAILKAIGNAQVGVYGGVLEKPDMGAPSFSRGREVVCMVIKLFYPLSSDTVSSPDSILSWVNDVSEKATRMWGWSMREVESN